jgi:hypothetical protein
MLLSDMKLKKRIKKKGREEDMFSVFQFFDSFGHAFQFVLKIGLVFFQPF